ncbi:MAG: hypothetical protein WC959_06875 [Kiritimatiellales bacterium]
MRVNDKMITRLGLLSLAAEHRGERSALPAPHDQKHPATSGENSPATEDGYLSNASQEKFNNKIGWLMRQAYRYRAEYLKIYGLPDLATQRQF